MSMVIATVTNHLEAPDLPGLFVVPLAAFFSLVGSLPRSSCT